MRVGARLSAVYREQLKVPPPPAELAHVLDHWGALRRHVPRGWALSPIPWAEIDAWQRVTRTPLTRLEVQLIDAIDALYLKVMTDGTSTNRTDRRGPGEPGHAPGV